MSAAVSHVKSDPEEARPAPDSFDGTATVTPPVLVRRNAGLAALVGAAASAIAIAYLWRAIGSAAPFDWVLCLLMAGLATFHLANLVDARTPLVVADEHGVRVRLGNQWRGLPWDAVREVVVRPRRGLLRDGRLVFAPHSLGRALDGLDARGRRVAALNQKAYGAALAVPMGLSTRVSARGSVLADDLAALAHGRAAVVVRRDGSSRMPEAEAGTESETEAVSGPAEAPALGGLVQLPGPHPGHEHADSGSSGGSGGPDGSGAGPGGSPDVPSGHDQPDDQPVRRRLLGLRRPAPPASDDPRVRPIATLGEPVETLVVDDFVTEPAYDPVIGPELAAARTRVGLSVDELAERTRIRPHVIESIEVDDFAPCGGDFYARGHLRTLARVLGRDPVAMLEQFDERYATAPINARRVFEAELATGMTGSMRTTVGGPSWALMLGVVLVLVLVWGVIRLFASEPPEQLQNPAPVLNGSAGVAGPAGPRLDPLPAAAPEPVRVTLVGAQGGSEVAVRDRSGTVVWAGEIVLGEERTVRATPPVRVRAEDGGAIAVVVDGADRGVLGRLGEPGLRTLHRAEGRSGDGSGAAADPPSTVR